MPRGSNRDRSAVSRAPRPRKQEKQPVALPPARPTSRAPSAAAEPGDGRMPKARVNVLFLCTGNACRSQMCEGWARHLKGNRIEAWSAGVAPHGLDPRAVQVMAE